MANGLAVVRPTFPGGVRSLTGRSAACSSIPSRRRQSPKRSSSSPRTAIDSGDSASGATMRR